MQTLPPLTGVVSIIDNATPESSLMTVLNMALSASTGADACVGYMHLRGWDAIADAVDRFAGEGLDKARVLVGMHADPQQEMRAAASLNPPRPTPDGPGRAQIRRTIKDQFEKQLVYGLPTNDFQQTLERLNRQLAEGKIQIKLYTRNRLHAKLYLTRRSDPIYPKFGIVGSSNLTAPGLWKQGELNVAVYDQNDCHRLQEWFNERWDDDHTIDITNIVIELLEKGWANDEVRPFHIYLRMAYHIATDGLEAEREFPIPAPFDKELFDFQKEAVKLAAKKLMREGGFEGVFLADVVGLGKTYMASAVVKVFQQDRGQRTLIISPKNLVNMWEGFVKEYNLLADVESISRYHKLPELRGHYGCVVIDESHNLRTRGTKRWEAVHKFIEYHRAKVVLLTATPLNKHYDDVGAQLRLFLEPDAELGVWPTRHMRALHEAGEVVPHKPTSLAAFEESEYSEDWRELLRLFMVRRTRQYLIDRGFASYDPTKERWFLLDSENLQRFFPLRQPKTINFKCNENDPNDQYARLYSEDVVSIVENLDLPRYGLAKYIDSKADIQGNDAGTVRDLGKAGKRLIGYCKINLFKRLESSGFSFLLSLERHIVRNLAFVYALENGHDIPIGQQNPEMMDPVFEDEDLFAVTNDEEEVDDSENGATRRVPTYDELMARAKIAYDRYAKEFANKFRWLPARYFIKALKKQLVDDSQELCRILEKAGQWNPARDENLKELHRLVSETHGKDKVLIFTQFADTAHYLYQQLHELGVDKVAVATGKSANPTDLAHRFSPESNRVGSKPKDEIRVLIATDVLSEGQNLQDCHVIVNYDLPWAIIRLIQRAGRVDRIGQENLTVYCYSFCFKEDEAVEKIIKLRSRLVKRLKMMGEVIGTDEQFLEETLNMDEQLRRLFAEDADILKDADGEVDLASEALKIWNTASEEDRTAALALSHNAYATRQNETEDEGVLVFARFGPARFGVARTTAEGEITSESLGDVLSAAACSPEEPGHPRHPEHHDLVTEAVKKMVKERRSEAGRLGSPREIRRKVYERMRHYVDAHKNSLFVTDTLHRAIERIYNAPLLEGARESLSRQIRLGVSDHDLAELVQRLFEDERLCTEPVESDPEEPQLVCSMGMWREVSFQ